MGTGTSKWERAEVQPAVASHRRGGPAHLRALRLQAQIPDWKAVAVSSVSAAPESVARRGAVLALLAACRVFGAALLTSLPKLWESVTVPLASAASADAVLLSAAVAPSAAQEAVDALQTLAILVRSVDEDLHAAMLQQVPLAARPAPVARQLSHVSCHA